MVLASEGVMEQYGGSILEIVPTRTTTRDLSANWLLKHSRNVTSEHGEDGILEKIFEVFPPTNRWLCEFGAFDGRRMSNAWSMIKEKGWNAVLIEPEVNCYNLLEQEYAGFANVHCLFRAVHFEGEDRIDNILASTPAPRDLDLMVIDIDGADYHILDSLQVYLPNILMVEFNAAIPTQVHFAQARDMGVRQGSSLRAVVELARSKGYELIGVTNWNAIFARADIAPRFGVSDNSIEELYRPPIEMKAFQLYDGTFVIAGYPHLLWHKVDLQPEDYQPLPRAYRTFSRRLAESTRIVSIAGQVDRDPGGEEWAALPGNPLGGFAGNVASRHGEDGILAEIFRRIGVTGKRFVDLGAGDGRTNSLSWSLAAEQGWTGLCVETDATYAEALAATWPAGGAVAIDVGPLSESGDRSIPALLERHGIAESFDFLTIRLHGPEAQVLRLVAGHRPRVVAALFNPTIPNEVLFEQAPGLDIHQGVSLQALKRAGETLGYRLVAVSLDTAFLVRDDLAGALPEVAGDLDDLYASPVLTRVFQLYDGTIGLDGCRWLLWHGLEIDAEAIQVLPRVIRRHCTEILGAPREALYRC